MLELAMQVGAALRRRHWRLAVAESCTSGLLGHWLTEVAGASDYFVGGVLCYANEVKRDLLVVTQTELERWGAVIPQVALAMAEGVRQLLHVEVGVGITGIAGPGGGTLTKLVGLTYIAIAAPGERWCFRRFWPGDRTANKAASAEAALRYLQLYLVGEV